MTCRGNKIWSVFQPGIAVNIELRSPRILHLPCPEELQLAITLALHVTYCLQQLLMPPKPCFDLYRPVHPSVLWCLVVNLQPNETSSGIVIFATMYQHQII